MDVSKKNGKPGGGEWVRGPCKNVYPGQRGLDNRISVTIIQRGETGYERKDKNGKRWGPRSWGKKEGGVLGGWYFQHGGGDSGRGQGGRKVGI